jgi:drug/metabolite transporter (DMT)-like permease
MPLGDSSVICNSYPVFVSILASLFLGEPFGGIFMFFATMVTLGGVVIVSRPPFMFGGETNIELVVSNNTK